MIDWLKIKKTKQNTRHKTVPDEQYFVKCVIKNLLKYIM